MKILLGGSMFNHRPFRLNIRDQLPESGEELREYIENLRSLLGDQQRCWGLDKQAIYLDLTLVCWCARSKRALWLPIIYVNRGLVDIFKSDDFCRLA